MQHKIHLLKIAEEIATVAHKGQVDKAGVDYINHPRTVASMCNSIDAKIVGWLHDVVEDTDVTFEDLKNSGFPENILEALRCVTKEENYQLDDYYLRIKKNELAKEVKLADLTHNSDLSRIPETMSEELKNKMKQKYQKYVLYKKYLLCNNYKDTISRFINEANKND